MKSTLNLLILTLQLRFKVEENVSAPRVARFNSYAFLAFSIRFLIFLLSNFYSGLKKWEEEKFKTFLSEFSAFSFIFLPCFLFSPFSLLNTSFDFFLQNLNVPRFFVGEILCQNYFLQDGRMGRIFTAIDFGNSTKNLSF